MTISAATRAKKSAAMKKFHARKKKAAAKPKAAQKKKAAAKPKSAKKTWPEFMKGKMSAYMKSEGGHKGAMQRLAKEYKAYKAK